MAYLLRFDGVNDRVLLSSEIALQSGDIVTFKVSSFVGPSGQNRYLMDSGALTRSFVIVRDDGTMRFNTSVISSLTIDGFPATDQVTVFPTDGLDHDIQITISAPCGLSRVGSAQNFLERWNADIKTITVERSSALIHNYNKQTLSGSNDTTLPDTEGGNNGTLLNFPTNNSQWILYGDGGGTVTADVTEVSTDAIESSSISISANITAQVTELSSSATELSAATFTTTVSVSVTELSDDASESSTATVINNLVTANVTELSTDFGESAAASFSGSLSAIVTELTQNAAESSSVNISANISLAVTELAQDFADNANVNLVGSFTVEVTETTTDFDEACYVQLPVQRLTPRKTISVNARRSGRISVNARRSQTIKVR